MGTRKLSEYIIDIVLFLTGVGLMISANGIDPGSSIGIGGDFMPKVCTKLWVLISIGLLLWEKGTPDDHVKGITADLKGFFGTLVLLLLYIAALNILGFILSSCIYMFIQMCIFVPKQLRDKKHYIIFAALSLIVPFSVNTLFVEVFSLLLPAGIF